MISLDLDLFASDSFDKFIGTVITTQDSPSTIKIDFVLNTDSDNSISTAEIVEIPKIDEIVIAVIIDIHKTNAYFANATVAKDSNTNYNSLNNLESLFPTDEWDTTIVTLKPLGVISKYGGKVQRLRYPISPGSLVHKSRSIIISKFLGLDTSPDGLHLGTIPTAQTPIKINITRLFQKHLAILAISGAGKSYTTSILIEELLIRSTDQGRIPVIIIDPHGEYTPFSDLLDQSSLASVYPGRHFSIKTDSLHAWNFKEFSPEISSVQVREIDKIIQDFKKDNYSYSFRDIIDKIMSSETIPNRTKDSLLGWLDNLQRTRIFGTNSYPDLHSIIKPGKISIFDLSDIQSLKIKQIICAYISRQAFELRRQNRVSPFILVIEEAHQFCPENGLTISKNIIETIAREGRKFFASLCLISQRPVNLSSTALSQCNSHLIMRIRNPYDLDYIGRLSEGIDRETQKMLPELEVGEGVLVGEAVNYPVLFKVRERKLNFKPKNMSLFDELNQFEFK